MAIVDFDRITKIGPEQASQISAAEVALGPITGGGGRSTLYDPLWGYFTFGQSLKCEYDEQDAYFDVAEFTITGVFTVAAENAEKPLSSPPAGSADLSDDDKFKGVVAAYVALENAFKTAANATAPTAYEQWGTASDPRCIVLPQPLLDNAGNLIYALPVDLDVEPGQWGKFIRYRATLREAKFPAAKVLVNDNVVDDGVIAITLPAPIITRKQMAGCTGEVVQIHNYTCAEFEVEGTVSGPPPTGNRTMTNVAHDLMTSLIADKVNIGVARLQSTSVVKDVIWPQLSTDEGSGVEVAIKDQACSVYVKARAGKA